MMASYSQNDASREVSPFQRHSGEVTSLGSLQERQRSQLDVCARAAYVLQAPFTALLSWSSLSTHNLHILHKNLEFGAGDVAHSRTFA